MGRPRLSDTQKIIDIAATMDTLEIEGVIELLKDMKRAFELREKKYARRQLTLEPGKDPAA